MKTLVLVVLALALVTSAPLVSAQSADLPTYAVGDTWKRSNGVEYKVVRVDSDNIIFEGLVADCKTCLVRSSAKDLTLIEATTADGKPLDPTQIRGVFIGSGWRFWDFPLQVGKEWRAGGTQFFRGSPSQLTADFRVYSIEDVKTPAGVFKAYRIVANWSGGAGSRWTNQLWYAPEVKAAVKMTSNNPNTSHWELLSYSVK